MCTTVTVCDETLEINRLIKKQSRLNTRICSLYFGSMIPQNYIWNGKTILSKNISPVITTADRHQFFT